MEDYSEIIPEGYEINYNNFDTVTDGDFFIMLNTIHSFRGYTGRTIEYVKSIGVKEVLKKRLTPLTEEEKINKLKMEARGFVKKHIKNPTEENYLKFEDAFVKNDNVGL